MIFVYDRIEKGEPVPNGYPRNFQYIHDTGRYFNKFGKEKTVHQLFEYSLPFKSSDDVEKDFIYPIHQFGAVEKLIGYDEQYSEFCFFHHIKPSTMKKLRDKKGTICIIAFEESRMEFRVMVFLHNLCKKFDIPTEIVSYLTGHNYTEIKKYEKWCSISKQKPITFINTLSQMYMKGGDLNKNNGTYVSQEEFESYKHRKHQFLCFNRRIRPPRYAVMAMLHHNNLVENNLISFSIEDIPNLNCLGTDLTPDIYTMIKIMGRDNPLLETYMGYFDELKQISPLTVDFPNLLDVMGPGCENKEPYLNSYFSIVTETAFNERLGITSEKIWRPMLHYHPFIIHGSPNTLDEIKKLGFKTFSPFIDERYDKEKNTAKRMQMFTDEVLRICSMDDEEIHQWYHSMKNILWHNRELIKEYGKKYVDFHSKVVLNTYNDIKDNLNV